MMSDSRISNASKLFVPLILGLGIVLRLYLLGRNELWLDEAHSIFIAGNSLGQVIKNLTWDGHPPLYFFLMLGWKTVFGESEFSVRLLSVVFGVGSLLLIYWLGAVIINRRIGLTSMFIAAIAPLHVFYSREARMYIMLVFLSVLTAAFLWLAITRGSRRYWAAYVLAAILLIYTHVFGWFVLLAGDVYLLVRRQGRQLVKLGLHQLVVLLAFAVWIPLVLKQMGQAGLWVPRLWLATPPALAIPKTLECFGAGGNYPAYLPFSQTSPLRFLSYAVFTFLAVTAVLRYGDGSVTKDRENLKSAKLYLLVNLFVPLLLPYAISFVKPIYLVGRYDVIAFPFYAVLISIGIMKLARFAWVGLAVVGLLASYSLGRYYTKPVSTFNKETVRYLARSAKEGDVVVSVGLRLCPLEYYMRRQDANFKVIAFPASIREHPGWLDFRQTEDQLVGEAERVEESARTASLPGRPVWVVITVQGTLNDILTDQFYRHFRPVSFDKELGVVCFIPK